MVYVKSKFLQKNASNGNINVEEKLRQICNPLGEILPSKRGNEALMSSTDDPFS